jgi:multisubunit Na+/H+ antiporter MnhB subunit
LYLSKNLSISSKLLDVLASVFDSISFLSLSLSFFFSAGDGTQGLELARQESITTPELLPVSIFLTFVESVVLFYFQMFRNS